MTHVISELFAGLSKPAIGLELELESTKPQPLDWIKGSLWTVHDDRSLRRNGVEYVFAKPLWGGDIAAALEQFRENTKNTKFIDDSIYGSTHVHYNVGHLYSTEIVSILLAWSILEDVFLSLCAPSRNGNLFALRYCDSNGFINTMLDGYKNRGEVYELFRMFSNDRWKYMNLNIATVRSIGTIEFRCYHSTADVDEISSWINRLINFCERAAALGNPVEVLEYADYNLAKFILDLTGVRPTDELVDHCRNNMSTAFRMAYVVPKWEDVKELRRTRKPEPKKAKTKSIPTRAEDPHPWNVAAREAVARGNFFTDSVTPNRPNRPIPMTAAEINRRGIDLRAAMSGAVEGRPIAVVGQDPTTIDIEEHDLDIPSGPLEWGNTQ